MADETRTLEIEIQTKGLDKLKATGKAFDGLAKSATGATGPLQDVEADLKDAAKAADKAGQDINELSGQFGQIGDIIGGKFGSAISNASSLTTGWTATTGMMTKALGFSASAFKPTQP